MPNNATTCPAWPELLKPATAAAMLDVSESTFRAIFPTLAAKYGLRIIGLGGPKFIKSNLLICLERLADRELDIIIDKAAGTVRIGPDVFNISSARSGKSGRGRPAKTTGSGHTHQSLAGTDNAGQGEENAT